MRYVCVSDIHGEYDKLIEALNNANFNKKTDTLISLGDPFDRGLKSKEVLEFLLSCPNRILIWGNHDYRLFQLFRCTANFQIEDKINGVTETLLSFCGSTSTKEQYCSALIMKLKSDDEYKETYTKLNRYFDECIFAAEFEEYILTHAWLPNFLMVHKKIEVYGLENNWRNAQKWYWEDAIWSNTGKLMNAYAYPDKTLVVGHWHTWRLRMNKASDFNTLDLSSLNCDVYIYQPKKRKPPLLIGIDGCTNLDNGKVNTFIFEDDYVPTFYDGRK